MISAGSAQDLLTRTCLLRRTCTRSCKDLLARIRQDLPQSTAPATKNEPEVNRGPHFVLRSRNVHGQLTRILLSENLQKKCWVPEAYPDLTPALISTFRTRTPQCGHTV